MSWIFLAGNDACAQMSLRRLVKCDLSQICSGIGIRCDQRVGVRIDEDAQRKMALI
jgi:hypothetical protein